MLQKLSMRTKLLACFGAVAFAATVAAVYSLSTIRGLRTKMHQEIVGSAERLDQARQITIGIANMRSAMRGVSLFSVMQNPEPLKKARAVFVTTASDMRKTIQQMESGDISQEERASVNTIRSSLEQWELGFQEMADLCEAGRAVEANATALKKMSPLIDALQKGAADFGKANSARRDAAIDSTEAAIHRNELITYFFVALVLVASGGGLVMVVGLARTLRDISESVGDGARQVAQAAAQVSRSSQSLAQGLSENAEALEKSSASANEINSMAQRNTENSQSAAGIVGHSEERFRETDQALSEMVVAMGEISSSSQKISKIIKVIDEIAFQTNILALNAAVEAARGRGGHGIRGGRRRSPQPGAALRPGGQRHLGAHRGIDCHLRWRQVQGGSGGGGASRGHRRVGAGQDSGG